MPEPRTKSLRKGVRLGMWSPRGQFLPFGTLVFAADGGIILAPVEVPGARWRYGEQRANVLPSRGSFSEVFVRPKLHYHQSGHVAASLSGVRIPRRTAQYSPLKDLFRAQILGLTAVRPWELASFGESRVGDVGTRETEWPQRVGWSIAILDHPTIEQSRVVLSLGNRGLIGGDKQRVVFDLREFGRDSLLVARIHLQYETSLDVQPSVTAAAYPAVERGVPDRAYVLWSSTARNPMLAYESSDDLISSDDLNDLSRFMPVRTGKLGGDRP